jgi:hypothetical protein
LAFGPDGDLYVAEGGVGAPLPSGHQTSASECPQVPPPIGPYSGSTTGADIVRVDPSGAASTAAEGFPSDQTAPSAGVTRNPNGAWVTRPARNFAISGRLERLSVLIRDRDSKFTDAFDTVFSSDGIRTS